MKLLIVAAAALIDGDGRILITQRPPGKAMAGLWEFPGGKLEPGEDPQICLAREIDEELGLKALPERILDSWLYRIAPGVEVVIVTYACAPLTGVTPRISHEHKKLELFAPGDIDALNMPDGYKASIRAFFREAR